MIRQMIRESDGVTFDTMRSINQDLTFDYAKWFFEKQKIDFKERNLGLIDADGYYTNAALLLGVESRTSSPVRVPRDPQSYEYVSLPGIYPCGEGAGYAGGIVSSAMDGINAARALAEKL